MAQQLAPFPPEEQPNSVSAFTTRLTRTGSLTTGGLRGGFNAVRQWPKGPALVTIMVGAALCGVITNAISSAGARAKRFAAFVAAEVQKDASSRNIKVITVGEPDSFEASSRPPAERRSKGYMIEANGNRTPYEAVSVQVCPDQEPSCWRVIRVFYGEPS